MLRVLVIAAVGLSLGGCQALPVAAWTAIGAGFGACAAACSPLINFEKDVFDTVVGNNRNPPSAESKQPSSP